MRIVMLLHKSVEHDSRVRREASALGRAGHDVTVVHLPRDPRHLELGPLDGFDVVSATPPGWVRRRLPFHLYRLAFFASFVRSVRALRPDVVHAHDAAMLAPGLLGARLTGAKLVYDSHEYAAGVPYRERGWALLVSALERAIVPRCAAVITVSDGIAERLRGRYGAIRTAVVRNFPDRAAYDWTFTAPDLRSELGAGDQPLVMHQGALARDRGCETLVRAVGLLPDYHLLFLGADDADYAARLRALATSSGVGARVHFRGSVPIAHLPAYTRRADVGVSLLQATCENHRLALPNKAFEYLMCGLPVVASDLPELRRVLATSPACRLVDPDDAHDVARGLRAAVSEGGSAREGDGGGERFSWATERERLLELYDSIEPDPRECSPPRDALVLVRNPCTHDARVLREVQVLDRLGYDTLVVGVVSASVTASPGEVAGVRVFRLAPKAPSAWLRSWAKGHDARPPAAASALGSQRDVSSAPARARALRSVNRFPRTLDYYRRAVGVVRRTRPSLVHCNDYNTAWVGVAAKALLGTTMVYDAHELWPDRNLRPEPRWWLLLCESLFVRVADRTITTSPGYAAVMARRYRVPEPQVVRNIPAWEAAGGAAKPDLNGDRTAVYFGAITRNRGLQTAIEALTHSPELRLRLIGPDAWGYREVLARRAQELGVDDRLELAGAVAPEHARQALAGAAVGLALIEPACLSYNLTLPNKLFEYTLAGIPILAGDTPLTANFVLERSIGLVADSRDPRRVAAALEYMFQPDTQARLREAVAVAQRDLSWNAESERLAATYRGACAARRERV